MGLETSRSLMQTHGPVLYGLNWMVQAIFIFEIVVRLLAYAPRMDRFFRDGWNLFDFTVIVLSLLPVAGPFAAVSRLARLLRVVRLVSVSADLRLIIETMLRSIPSMGHVALLMAVLVYVYAIMGYYLFHRVDPERWGELGRALLSVFQMLTLDDWMAMQRAVLPVYPFSWLYFASFVVVGVFVVINLFIAVVLNNLDTVKAEQAARDARPDDILRRVAALRAELDAFEAAARGTVGSGRRLE